MSEHLSSPEEKTPQAELETLLGNFFARAQELHLQGENYIYTDDSHEICMVQKADGGLAYVKRPLLDANQEMFSTYEIEEQRDGHDDETQPVQLTRFIEVGKAGEVAEYLDTAEGPRYMPLNQPEIRAINEVFAQADLVPMA